MKTILLTFVASVLVLSACGDEATDRTAFEAARQLDREGRAHEAFEKFLAIPGCEFHAQIIGRREPEDFLRVLRADPQAQGSPRARLVEADLLLSLGRRTEAARL